MHKKHYCNSESKTIVQKKMHDIFNYALILHYAFPRLTSFIHSLIRTLHIYYNAESVTIIH